MLLVIYHSGVRGSNTHKSCSTEACGYQNLIHAVFKYDQFVSYDLKVMGTTLRLCHYNALDHNGVSAQVANHILDVKLLTAGIL